MGTNYYVRTNECAHCGRFETLHIGKSSGGWVFALHVTDELPDWEAWKKFLVGHLIYNEYGDIVPAEEFRGIVEDRSRPDFDTRSWHGYGNESAFHHANDSVRGPRGLLRAREEPGRVTHGPGTWDCHRGEFA